MWLKQSFQSGIWWKRIRNLSRICDSRHSSVPTPPIKRATLKIAVQVHVKIFVRKFQALYFSLHFDVVVFRWVLFGKNYVWSCKVVTRFCNAESTSRSSHSVVSWLVETVNLFPLVVLSPFWSVTTQLTCQNQIKLFTALWLSQ